MDQQHPPKPAPATEATIYRKLARSPLYLAYRQAFVECTGLGLALVPFRGDAGQASPPEAHENSFCRQLHDRGREACRRCRGACDQLRAAAGEGPRTLVCFAGMRESAVPVLAAGRVLALLVAGQVFTSPPAPEDFRSVREQLAGSGLSKREIDALQRKWLQGPVRSLPQYESAITMLKYFAQQLSESLNRLLIEATQAEPRAVIRAKQFVRANLEERLSLDEVARHAGVSSFHLCKVFKQSTGMTLTEYANRSRIEKAKKELLNPQNRVTEIAYDVGFQSLSQFNRSFLKYVGLSPTGYRERAKAEDRATAMRAA